MKTRVSKMRAWEYLLATLITLAVMILCVCLGSVNIPIKDIFTALWNTLFNLPIPEKVAHSIIIYVRLPRVLCVVLVGAALSLSGAAMQGLLRNPLADGSTLGVSSGASLGAVIAIAFGVHVPFFGQLGITAMAMLFAFLSLILILSLAHRLDYSLSTNTIILLGVVFSMFATSLISLITAFVPDGKLRSITFWTMGSLAGSTYGNVLTMLATVLIGIVVLFFHAQQLNAFAISENNARHIGINVRRTKYVVMATVAVLIGVSVSVGGSIGFVGLVIPHMMRLISGPNHRRLLPISMFAGAIFLMLADLISRTILRPKELPIGVVTSLVGSIVFIFIFYRSRKLE